MSLSEGMAGQGQRSMGVGQRLLKATKTENVDCHNDTYSKHDI